jgi:hypothetical protein
MTDQRFDTHFGADRQFRLDWDQFYKKVDEGLVRDGYKCYSRWFNQLHPPMPKQQKPKRCRPDDETDKTSEASKKSPKKSRVEVVFSIILYAAFTHFFFVSSWIHVLVIR